MAVSYTHLDVYKRQVRDMVLYKGHYLISDLVSVSGDAVAAVLSWPVRQSRNVKCLTGLVVLGSRERSPVRSFRCGHSHWTRG